VGALVLLLLLLVVALPAVLLALEACKNKVSLIEATGAGQTLAVLLDRGAA
jgi:hypothetical protein